MGNIKRYKLKRVINGSANNSTKYWGKFQYEKKDGTREDVTLTADFGVVTGNMDLKGKKVFSVSFSKPFFEYEIIVDSENNAQKLFVEKLKLDPKVHSTGALKTGHLWQLVDENYEAIQTALEIKKRANVTNKVYSLSAEDLSKLCYYLNVSINGKKKEEIYGLLLHPSKGKIFSKSVREENNFVDIVLQGNFGSDFEVKSSVNKAVVLGIIKNVNGAYYMGNGGNVLGTTIDSVYAFFIENKAVFNNGLLPELQNRDILPESIDYSGELQSVMNNIEAEKSTTLLGEDNKLSEEARQNLIKRAEELNVSGRINIKKWTDAVLIDKVTKAENELKDKSNV